MMTNIAAGSVARQFRRGSELGVTCDSVRVDLDQVMAHVRSCICTIEPEDSRESLQEDGITVLAGRARFERPGLLAVAGTTQRFRQSVLAMGAAPALPQVPGLSDVDPLTSESLWTMTPLPERMVVLGAGSHGRRWRPDRHRGPGGECQVLRGGRRGTDTDRRSPPAGCLRQAPGDRRADPPDRPGSDWSGSGSPWTAAGSSGSHRCCGRRIPGSGRPAI